MKFVGEKDTCKSRSSVLVTGISPFLSILVHRGKLHFFIYLYHTILSKSMKAYKKKKKAANNKLHYSKYLIPLDTVKLMFRYQQVLKTLIQIVFDRTK